MKPLKVGTRKSPLAMRQTQIVLELLREIVPEQAFEIVGLSTKGDRLQQAPLSEIGGKGVFVKEVEYHLQQGTIDFAVHSLKDLPARLPEDLILAATPKRASALDCLIWRECALPKTAKMVIGTSSIRRAKQLAQQFPQAEFVPIRGKIETRLEKMHQEGMDATVLACAGLERMAYFSDLTAYQVLSATKCVPAVGQGILGVECRKEDGALRSLLAQITDADTAQAAAAERCFLQKMEGNCELPVGGYAFKEEVWHFHAFLAENREAVGRSIQLTGSEPLSLAEKAYQKLR